MALRTTKFKADLKTVTHYFHKILPLNNRLLNAANAVRKQVTNQNSCFIVSSMH